MPRHCVCVFVCLIAERHHRVCDEGGEPAGQPDRAWDRLHEQQNQRGRLHLIHCSCSGPSASLSLSFIFSPLSLCFPPPLSVSSLFHSLLYLSAPPPPPPPPPHPRLLFHSLLYLSTSPTPTLPLFHSLLYFAASPRPSLSPLSFILCASPPPISCFILTSISPHPPLSFILSAPPPPPLHSLFCLSASPPPLSLLTFSLCPLSLLCHPPPPPPTPHFLVCPPSVSPGRDWVIFACVAVTVPDWQCDTADIQELGEGTGDPDRAEWTVDRWRQWPRGSQRLP